MEGHFMNELTKKCESCHSSCSACSGPLPTDCINCKAGLFFDNMHCVPCCSDTTNEVAECCKCVLPDGPCASIDFTRSIELMADGTDLRVFSFMYLINNFSLFLLYFCLIIICVFLVTLLVKKQIKIHQHKRSETFYNVNYSKLPNRRRIIGKHFNSEEEDDDENTLFEKA